MGVYARGRENSEFTFEWRKNYSELFYEYKITPKLGKTKILSRIIKIVKEV